jgi:transcription elongation factor Elf1
MPDVLADGTFGRDDGWTCPECGAKTYLTDNQGYGLCGYNCENCDAAFQVQYEVDDSEEDDSDYYEPSYDIYAEDVL